MIISETEIHYEILCKFVVHLYSKPLSSATCWQLTADLLFLRQVPSPIFLKKQKILSINENVKL